MNYKIIGNNDYSGNIISEYFKNRKIDNYYDFINLKNHKLVNPLSFLNMQKAIDTFLEYIKKNKKIAIIVDEDVDGYTSAAIVHNFIKKEYPSIKIIPIIHTRNKAHGIILDDINNDILDNIDLLIVPDAGSNDTEAINKLNLNHNIETIILDHHQYVSMGNNKCGIIVNNQENNSPNSDLTGSAMAYLFVKAVAEQININIGNDYQDLCMLGLIGDTADSLNLDVQYLIQNGINNINNKLILGLIDANSYSLGGELTQQSFIWSICPAINAVVRYGTFEQRELMFKAFCEDESEEYQYTFKRGENKGKTVSETIYDNVARITISLRAKQQRETKKIIEGNTRQKGLNESINNTDKTKVIVVDVSNVIGDDSALTGLLANKISGIYQKPCLILRKKVPKYEEDENTEDVCYTGSGRGDQIISFMSILKDSGIMDVAGHEAAFGIKKYNGNIQDLQKQLDTLFKKETLEKVNLVDFYIPSNDMIDEIIEDLYSTKDVWGHGITPPSIYVDTITIPTNDIKVSGANNQILSFNYNYVNYIYMRLNDNERDELITWDDTTTLNVIGRPNIYENADGRFCQIIIEQIEKLNNGDDQGNIVWKEEVFDEEYKW